MTFFPALVLGSLLSKQASDAPEVVVYNGGFALVKEQRVLNLIAGSQEVEVKDVAAMIEANSVAIRSISSPGSFTVWEQNYRYDLISPQAILAKAVGQKITFNRVLPDGKTERLVGTLMSAPTAVVSDGGGNQRMSWNGMVIQTDDGRVILNPSGEIEVSSIPNGLISRPTLVWTVDSAMAGSNTVALSYITRGMLWNADYVLSLDKDGKMGDLKGWVTMTNNSGTTFEGAKLKLLAGQVYRARQQPGGARGGAEMDMAKSAMQEESFADYHLYTLPRATTIRSNEIKQLNLLEATGVSVNRRLIAEMNQNFGFRPPSQVNTDQRSANPKVIIEFKNEQKNKMGMALPQGTFKVFQPDSSGSPLLIGEAFINHTPKDETLSLAVGEAFDIIVESRRVELTPFPKAGGVTGYDELFEIEVRNRKGVAQPVVVRVQHAPGTTLIFDKMEGKKLDAGSWEFLVNMKANEVQKFTYRTQVRTQ